MIGVLLLQNLFDESKVYFAVVAAIRGNKC